MLTVYFYFLTVIKWTTMQNFVKWTNQYITLLNTVIIIQSISQMLILIWFEILKKNKPPFSQLFWTGIVKFPDFSLIFSFLSNSLNFPHRDFFFIIFPVFPVFQSPWPTWLGCGLTSHFGDSIIPIDLCFQCIFKACGNKCCYLYFPFRSLIKVCLT